MNDVAGRIERVLAALDEYWVKHALPPTLRELCDLSGEPSTSQVVNALQRAAKQGRVECLAAKGASRAYVPAWAAAAVRGRAEPIALLSAAEALYGFAAWLTGRPAPIVLSSDYDAGPLVELVATFCAANGLPAPRPGWIEHLTMPSTQP